MQVLRQQKRFVSEAAPKPRSRGVLWPVLIISGCALLGVVYLLKLRTQPMGDGDYAALIRAKDLGFAASDENESFEKRAMLDGTTEVHYRAHGLGAHQRATIDEMTFAYMTSANAVLGFEGMRIGGSKSFELAARSGERMVERNVQYPWADAAFWADYRVGDAQAGAFVIVRKGSTVHFISLNGMTLDKSKVDALLREHWS